MKREQEETPETNNAQPGAKKRRTDNRRDNLAKLATTAMIKYANTKALPESWTVVSIGQGNGAHSVYQVCWSAETTNVEKQLVMETFFILFPLDSMVIYDERYVDGFMRFLHSGVLEGIDEDGESDDDDAHHGPRDWWHAIEKERLHSLQQLYLPEDRSHRPIVTKTDDYEPFPYFKFDDEGEPKECTYQPLHFSGPTFVISGWSSV